MAGSSWAENSYQDVLILDRKQVRKDLSKYNSSE
jgi:hypothetical protein